MRTWKRALALLLALTMLVPAGVTALADAEPLQAEIPLGEEAQLAPEPEEIETEEAPEPVQAELAEVTTETAPDFSGLVNIASMASITYNTTSGEQHDAGKISSWLDGSIAIGDPYETTFWGTALPASDSGAWVQLDLGRPMNIMGFQLAGSANDTNAEHYYTCQWSTSTDGTTWTTQEGSTKVARNVSDGQGNTCSKKYDTATSVRYIKFTLTGNSTGSYGAMAELRVFADPADVSLRHMGWGHLGTTNVGSEVSTMGDSVKFGMSGRDQNNYPTNNCSVWTNPVINAALAAHTEERTISFDIKPTDNYWGVALFAEAISGGRKGLLIAPNNGNTTWLVQCYGNGNDNDPWKSVNIGDFVPMIPVNETSKIEISWTNAETPVVKFAVTPKGGTRSETTVAYTGFSEGGTAGVDVTERVKTLAAASQKVAIRAGNNTDVTISNFRYSGEPAGQTVSGQVTDGGTGVEGATVIMGGMTTTTDGSGNYSFAYVPRGTHTAYAIKDSKEKSIEVTVGTEDLTGKDFALTEVNRSIEVTVKQKGTETILTDATVMLEDADYHKVADTEELTAATDNKYTFSMGGNTGTYNVRVSKAGYDTVTKEVTVSAADAADAIKGVTAELTELPAADKIDFTQTGVRYLNGTDVTKNEESGDANSITFSHRSGRWNPMVVDGKQAINATMEFDALWKHEGARWAIAMRAKDGRDLILVNQLDDNSKYGYEFRTNDVPGWNVDIKQGPSYSKDVQRHFKVQMAGNEFSLWIDGIEVLKDIAVTYNNGNLNAHTGVGFWGFGHDSESASLSDADITISNLYFTRDDHQNTVTISTPENGSVTIDSGTTAVDGAQKAYTGDTVTVIAAPTNTATHELRTLTVTKTDGTTVEVTGEGNTRSFVMPDGPVTVEATFGELSFPVTAYHCEANKWILKWNSDITASIQVGTEAAEEVSNGEKELTVADLTNVTMTADGGTRSARFETVDLRLTQRTEFSTPIDMTDPNDSNNRTDISKNIIGVDTVNGGIIVDNTAFDLITYTGWGTDKPNSIVTGVQGSDNYYGYTDGWANAHNPHIATMTFYGTGVDVIMRRCGNDVHNVVVKIDGVQQGSTIDAASDTEHIGSVYKTNDLTLGVHTIEVTMTPLQSDEHINFDCFKVYGNTTQTLTMGTMTDGSVTAEPSGTVRDGATVTLTPAPETGYELETLTYTVEGGEAVTIEPQENAYSFVMPVGNVTVNATFNAVATEAPSAPTNLTAKAGYARVRLAWEHDTTIQTLGYKIFRAESEEAVNTAAQNVTAETEAHATVGAGTTTYDDTGLEANKTYYYKVVAYNNVGGAASAAAHNAEATGWEGLSKNSTLVKDFTTNPSFDGTTQVELTTGDNGELDKVKNLDKGTILFVLRNSDTSDTKRSIFFVDGPTADLTVFKNLAGSDADNNKKHPIRFDWVSPLGFATPDDEMGSVWQSVVFSCGDAYACWMNKGTNTIDYGGLGQWNSAEHNGFLTRGGTATTMSIGGGGARLEKWLGEIAYVIITDEVLTQAQQIALTTLHDISTSGVTGGTIAPAEGTVLLESDVYKAPAGAVVTLDVTPSTGYTYTENSLAVYAASDTSKTKNLVQEGKTSFVMPAEGVTVEASFTPIQYDVTFEGENAAVKVNNETVTSQKVNHGDTLSFTVEAAEGYTVTAVKIGENAVTESEGTYTTGEITGNTTVTITTKRNSTALASLKVTVGEAEETLTAGDDGNYAITVGSGVTSVTVTPTVEENSDATAVVKVGENAQDGGVVALSGTSTEISVVVTAEDGTTKTYAITVTKKTSAIGDSMALSKTAPVVGDELSVTGLTENATVTYSWEVGDGTPTTEATYTVLAADVGKTITVTVTGTGNFDGTWTSAATSPVAKKAGPDAPTGLTSSPCVQGGAANGAITGLSADVKYQYKLASADDNAWTAVADGATSIENLNAGEYQVRVKASDETEAGAPAEVTVDAKAAAPTELTVSAPETYDGQGKINGTTAAMEYQATDATDKNAWTACTATSTDVDAGKSYLVRVKETDSVLASDTITTDQVPEYVKKDIGGTVSITGTATVGETLTANTSAVTPEGVRLTYQWKRTPASGTATDISGATSSTYQLVAADVGCTITVTVQASDQDNYTNTELTSEPTAAVVKLPTEAPKAGINYADETLTGLTAGTYTISGAEVTVAADQTTTPIQAAWFGMTLSIVRKGDETHDDSAAQSLEIPARPTIANAAEAYTVDYATEQVTVKTGYNYLISDATDTPAYTACNLVGNGSTKQIFSTGSFLYVYKTATSAAFHSEVAQFAAPGRETMTTVPSIDFVNETITGTANLEYRVDGRSVEWTACGDTERMDVKDEAFGWGDGNQAVTVYFAKPHGTDTYASQEVDVEIPARPAAPTGITPSAPTESGGKGKVTLPTEHTNWQCKIGTAGNYADVPEGTEIGELDGGAVVFFQVKAVNASEEPAVTGSFASAETKITVPTYGKHSITVTNPQNGTVTVTVGEAATATNEAAEGDDVTLTLVPNTGYEVGTVTVNGTSEVTVEDTGTTRTFTMPNENVTVTVTFNAISYNITKAGVGDGGSFTVNVNGAESATATVGANITVVEAPAAGYELTGLNWKTTSDTETANNILSTKHFEMPADNVTITATFTLKKYSVDTTGVTSGVTVSGEAPTEVTHGTGLSITLAADTGYKLPATVSVSMGGEPLEVADYTYADGTITITSVTGDVTISATGVAMSTDASLSALTINPGALNPTFSANVTKYAATVEYNVDEVTVTATKNDESATVTGDGEKTLNVGENIITITVAPEHGAVKTYTITVTRKPDKSGLETAITAANTAKTNAGTALANDITANQVEKGVKYVTEAQMAALNSAITTAEGVKNNANATQTEVDNAKTALETATTTFTNQLNSQVGTLVVITITSPSEGTTVSVVAGNALNLTVAATTNPENETLTYSWKKGETTLEGGTATFTKNSVTMDDAGTYTCTVSVTGEGAYAESKTVTITVDVSAAEKPATGITLSENTVSVEKDKSVTVTATMAPSDTTDTLTVDSTDKTVATAVLNGDTITITGVAKGNTTVTVTANDKVSETINVTVTEPVVTPTTYGLTLNLTNVSADKTAGADVLTANSKLEVQLSVTGNYALPTSVTVTMSGTTLEAGTGYTYASGKITIASVTGDVVITAAGTEVTPPTPTDKNITAITQPDAVTVAYGTAESALGLPATVEVTLDDSSKQDVAVTWTCTTAYDGNTAGDYTFNGALSLPSGVTNTGNKTVSITVTVKAQVVTPPTTYTVTVTGGTGGGQFEAGVSVTINAGAAPEGKRFKEWTITGVDVTDKTQTSVTFTMPSGNVTAVAVYEDIPSVPVTVKGYTGAYDGKAHGISVTSTVSNAVIKYGTTADGCTLSASPTKTNVADTPFTVYYQVTAPGYKTVTGSATIEITKATVTEFTLSADPSYINCAENTERTVRFTATANGLNTKAVEIACDSADVTVDAMAMATIVLDKTAKYEFTATLKDGNFEGNPTAKCTVTVNGSDTELKDIAPEAVTATGFEGVYDGEAKTITVTVDSTVAGAEVLYSATENGSYTAAQPEVVNVGEHPVYFQVIAAGYNPYSGSAVIKITKATPEVKIEANPKELQGAGNVTLTVTAPSEGTVSVTCDQASAEVVNNGDGTFTATLPNETMEYVFTATYAASANYEAGTGYCVVKVTKADAGEVIAADKAKVESKSYTTTQAEAGDQDAAVEAAKKLLAELELSSDATVNVVEYVAAVAGTSASTRGQNGKLTFTVTLSKADADSVTTKELTMTITATPYAGGSSTGSGSTGGNTGTGSRPVTTENPDGSTTTTVTDRKGTVTETTQKPDGTVEVVETKKDGTVTATITQPDGAKIEAVTIPDEGKTITVTDNQGEVEAAVSIPAVIAEPEVPFVDVPENHWAQKAINTIHSLGLVKGVDEDAHIYDMATPMTRGALVTVLHRFSNGKTDLESAFDDVAEGTWYSDGVAWAAKTGVVNGYNEHTFAPEDTITRQQLTVMLYRYAKLLGMDVTVDEDVDVSAFNDADQIGSWATDAMAWAYATGLVQGRGAGELAPTAEASRAEVATVLARFIDLLK